MRPIPKCDLVPEHLQGRPWWRLHGVAGASRRDGWHMQRRYQGGLDIFAPGDRAPRLDRPMMAMREDALEVIDTEHPIPAPPLRAGQVWLLEALNTATTYLVGGTEPPQRAAWFPPQTDPYHLGWHPDRGWHPGLREGSATWGAITVRYYLLFDPIDPACAPWSAP
jgi:hypothetical protein